MNTKILTTVLAALLLVSFVPLAFGQEITVAASKAVYNPGDQLVVAGTAPANSFVTLQVYNPNDDLIAFDQVQADGTGAYTKNIFTWPPAGTDRYPFGKYKIRAFAVANEAWVEVEYQAAAPPPPTVGGPVIVQVAAGDLFYGGETNRIFILITNATGDAIDPVTPFKVAHVQRPDGSIDTLGNPTRVHAGWYYIDYTVPNAVGVYGVHIAAVYQEVTGNGIATFQVTDSIAKESSVAALGPKIDALNRRFDDIKSAVDDAKSSITDAISSAQAAIASKIDSAQSAITGSVTSAQNAITGALTNTENSLKTEIGNAATGIKSDIAGLGASLGGKIDGLKADTSATMEAVAGLQAGIGQTSTFILVVAALAVITLILELVILVRKLS